MKYIIVRILIINHMVTRNRDSLKLVKIRREFILVSRRRILQGPIFRRVAESYRNEKIIRHTVFYSHSFTLTLVPFLTSLPSEECLTFVFILQAYPSLYYELTSSEKTKDLLPHNFGLHGTLNFWKARSSLDSLLQACYLHIQLKMSLFQIPQRGY